MNALQFQQMAMVFPGASLNRETVTDKRGERFTKITASNGNRNTVFRVTPEHEEDTTIAYAYTTLEGTSLHGRDLHVLPEYRGRGLGAILLKSILDLARQQGATKVWGKTVQKDLNENPYLEDWYVRCGATLGAPEPEVEGMAHSVEFDLAEAAADHA